MHAPRERASIPANAWYSCPPTPPHPLLFLDYSTVGHRTSAGVMIPAATCGEGWIRGTSPAQPPANSLPSLAIPSLGLAPFSLLPGPYIVMRFHKYQGRLSASTSNRSAAKAMAEASCKLPSLSQTPNISIFCFSSKAPETASGALGPFPPVPQALHRRLQGDQGARVRGPQHLALGESGVRGWLCSVHADASRC